MYLSQLMALSTEGSRLQLIGWNINEYLLVSNIKPDLIYGTGNSYEVKKFTQGVEQVPFGLSNFELETEDWRGYQGFNNYGGVVQFQSAGDSTQSYKIVSIELDEGVLDNSAGAVSFTPGNGTDLAAAAAQLESFLKSSGYMLPGGVLTLDVQAGSPGLILIEELSATEMETTTEVMVFVFKNDITTNEEDILIDRNQI